MPVNPLVRQFDLDEDELARQIDTALSGEKLDEIGDLYNESVRDFEVDKILTGKIVNVINNKDVVVDIGYKSEGVIPIEQFENPSAVAPGQEVEVLLESVEDEEGMIALSKRKADRIRAWERVIATHKEGDVVSGRAIKKIKGGLLIDIGVPVFLPASQIGIRRPGDISDYVGQELECKIIKIDESRMNIVVSRRRLLEEKRETQKKNLLEEIEVDQIRKGVVKNITDFGAFVDLGGIDGLLHITDMSWGRVSHPSDVVSIDQEIEVKVLKVDKEKERISLGLKQKTESPWVSIEEKYPVGSRIKGKVVNVLSYGAFVQLEEGVEGLVHVSEMSWTKRVNHPSQMVSVGDEIEVVVLEIKKEKQEISLGMKQVEVNPWTLVEEKYPPGMKVKGKVRNLTNYGAFVELEDGIDGLLHVADMSWTRKVVHPSEVLKKGDEIEAMVLQVDQDRKRIALGLKQLSEDPWKHAIPDRYQVGFIVHGVVTKITNFGVFVRLEDELEGLLHISELSDHKVASPEEVVKVGDEIDVKIIKVDPENRKIGLSLREVREEDLIARDEALARAAESGAAEGSGGSAEAGGEETAGEAPAEPAGTASAEPAPEPVAQAAAEQPAAPEEPAAEAPASAAEAAEAAAPEERTEEAGAAPAGAEAPETAATAGATTDAAGAPEDAPAAGAGDASGDGGEPPRESNPGV